MVLRSVQEADGVWTSLGILASETSIARCASRITECLSGRRWHHVSVESPSFDDVAIAYFSRDVFAKSGWDRGSESRKLVDAANRAGRLDWMQLFSAGADHPAYRDLRTRGVSLTTASGASAEPVALTAFTGMLMLSRGFIATLRAQSERRWLDVSQLEQPADLSTQTALVIGTGPVGIEIGRLCRAVGMTTIALRRSDAACADFENTLAYTRLGEVLPAADWIFVACPLTATTFHLLDRAALAIVKPGASIINVSRGAVVEESALIDALAARRLAGAYLDVFATEPLDKTSPLWDLPNVILTPHFAARSSGLDSRVDAIFLENLSRWTNRRPLLNSVPLGPI